MKEAGTNEDVLTTDELCGGIKGPLLLDIDSAAEVTIESAIDMDSAVVTLDTVVSFCFLSAFSASMKLCVTPPGNR